MKNTMLDHEKQIRDYERTIAQLKEQNKVNGIWTDEEIVKLENKLEKLKHQVYSHLTPWERVMICRHAQRPRSVDYIKNLCESFTEIFGDRLFRDDHSIVTGLAMIGGKKFVIIAQEKGCDTDSRLFRNFGMPHPEGYRKALRAMKLAEKFHLPVLSFLDTPGAYPGLTAEERGQGVAIATNLLEMARLKTPVIIVLIGEGCSGGALGMGVGDIVGMLEHAYYSVISPEGCASILWHDAAKNEIAAEALRMHAEDLLEFGVIDKIIEEPQGGAHHNPKVVYENVKKFILKERERLTKIPLDELLESRYQKFRKLGAISIAETSQ
ncbi:acetyl-CoA carboxylase carboxyltransferase subunit alpha [Simkania negevensis]|uniref:Acetyl-coenzyme A carboxylase carboxyl transferase subunit alpha n=1 Tax=Simkania negevensis (strain ATCC VR-1471 / DSM 27360 / Z) TaxID=331113 RepID=F8L7E7_SIMNZ|nr:acetyl-CoA carboxylase carboxyltransferase subunit alpha [Simkania negevensis]CCB88678.1 acetyl-coenzyme A carboxylase carboxyl transferase subunit alpha [Simkania negevensis Z]